MELLIKNYELAGLIRTIRGVKRRSGKIAGSTLLKLRKATGVMLRLYEEFSDVLGELKENHVQKDKTGDFKTKINQAGEEEWVFKSPEDEAAFVEVTELVNTVEIERPLDDSDIAQLILDEAELQTLELIHIDYARRSEPKSKQQSKNKAE